MFRGPGESTGKYNNPEIEVRFGRLNREEFKAVFGKSPDSKTKKLDDPFEDVDTASQTRGGVHAVFSTKETIDTFGVDTTGLNGKELQDVINDNDTGKKEYLAAIEVETEEAEKFLAGIESRLSSQMERNEALMEGLSESDRAFYDEIDSLAGTQRGTSRRRTRRNGNRLLTISNDQEAA